MIIGIVGNAGAGKSTLAAIIKDLVPGAVDIALAGPIKRFCKEVFDFTDEQLYGPSEARDAPDERYPAEAKPEREISDDLAACLLSVRSGHSPKPSPEIREVAVDLSRFTMPGDAALEDKGIGDIPTAFWPDLD